MFGDKKKIIIKCLNILIRHCMTNFLNGKYNQPEYVLISLAQIFAWCTEAFYSRRCIYQIWKTDEILKCTDCPKYPFYVNDIFLATAYFGWDLSIILNELLVPPTPCNSFALFVLTDKIEWWWRNTAILWDFQKKHR